MDRVLTEDTMGFAAEPVEVVDELGFDEGDFENQPTVVASDIRLEDLAALTEAEPEPWAALQRATLKGLAGEGLEPSDTAQEPDGALEVPFGGRKNSGVGQVNGAEGLRNFCFAQPILTERLAPAAEWVWPPYTEQKLEQMKKALKWMWGTPLRWLL